MFDSYYPPVAIFWQREQAYTRSDRPDLAVTQRSILCHPLVLWYAKRVEQLACFVRDDGLEEYGANAEGFQGDGVGLRNSLGRDVTSPWGGVRQEGVDLCSPCETLPPHNTTC